MLMSATDPKLTRLLPTREASSFAMRDQSIDSQSNSESEWGCVCDAGGVTCQAILSNAV